MRSNKQEYTEKKGDNTRVMKLFSIPTQANEGMKTKVNILALLYKYLLKGGLTLRLGLSPLSST